MKKIKTFTKLQIQEINHAIDVWQDTIDDEIELAEEFQLNGGLSALKHKIYSGENNLTPPEIQWIIEELEYFIDIAEYNRGLVGFRVQGYINSMESAIVKLKNL